jgi:hypothetical protein
VNSFSPTSAGFRLIFRRPAIPFAEMAWRWSFAGAAWVLGILFLFEYMDSLPVTTVDRLLLQTRQPALVARALHRILAGSTFRFTEAAVLLVISLGIAWVVLASFGRMATVNAVLEEFQVAPPSRTRGLFGSLLALNILRTAVTVTAIASALGSLLVANSLWASIPISTADATRIYVLILFFVWLAWIVLNWLLSTAAILAVTEVSRAFTAMARTVRLCYDKPLALLSGGGLFGLLHLGAFMAFAATGLVILGALGSIPAGVILLLLAALLAAYCAVADFLYTGRLAAYVLMISGNEALALFQSPPVAPLEPSARNARVDQNEVILSDVPLPAG